MALILTEDFNSRQWFAGERRTVEFFYTLTGTADDLEAFVFVKNNTPTGHDDLLRRDINIFPEWVDTIKGDGLWRVVIEYGIKGLGGVGTSSFSFDTTGGIQHTTQSLATIHRVDTAGVNGSNQPDHKGAIGVTKDGADGVDLIVPIYKFFETHFFFDATVNNAFKATIFQLTGRVNSFTFREFDPGELLFLGARGSQRGADEWEITYGFAALPNRTDISLGDLALIPTKWGWEHLWVQYEKKTIGSGSSIRQVTVPVAAFVEKVYETGNMSSLNID